MRKVFLLLLILFPINTLATEYTEYGEYQYSDEKIEATELIEVEEEKQYRFYINKKQYSNNYYLEGQNSKKYPKKSKISKLTSPSKYSLDKPNIVKNRIIESKEGFIYQKLKPIRYIKIDNLESSCFYLLIKNIRIYINKTLLEYDYEISPVTSRKYQIGYLKKDQGSILIDLKENYDLDQIDILIEGYSGTVAVYHFDMHFHYDYLFPNEYVKTTRTIDFDLGSQQNDYFMITEDMIINKTYDEIKIENIKDMSSFIINEIKQIWYRYQDKLFRYYKKSRGYLNGYFDNVNGYIKDTKKYVIKYKYRVREYVEEPIKEEIIKKDKTNLQNDFPRHMGFGILISLMIALVYLLYHLVKEKGEKC